MPKRTKKQKLKASERRKIHAHREQTIERQVPPSSTSNPFTFSVSAETYDVKSDRTIAPKRTPHLGYEYVFTDVKKILLFTLLAIGLQVVLVFLLRTK